jgi:hypothetical protein
MENNQPKQVKISKTKIVNIKPWTTKTKKDFVRSLKKNGKSIDEYTIFKDLFFPYIEPNNEYYTINETQYLLYNIRKISAKTDLDFLISCAECGEAIEVQCDMEDLVFYEEGKIPLEKDGISWVNINDSLSWRNFSSTKKGVEKFFEITDKYSDESPVGLEMALSIAKINDKEIQNLDEILEELENLSLDRYNELLKTYDEIKSQFEIKIEKTCPNCDYTDTYYFESIPEFFDPLMPKID